MCAGLELPQGVALLQLKNFPALISRTSETVVENNGFHPNACWFAATPPSAGAKALARAQAQPRAHALHATNA
jgi:hypothetical protein